MNKKIFVYNCEDPEAPSIYHKYDGQKCVIESFIENGTYLVRFDDGTTLDALSEELTFLTYEENKEV